MLNKKAKLESFKRNQNMLDKTELEFFKMFSKDLSENMGNAGCNDCVLPNTPENREFLKKVFEWGYEPEDAEQYIAEMEDQKDESHIYTMDIMIWDYLDHLIRKASGDKDD